MAKKKDAIAIKKELIALQKQLVGEPPTSPLNRLANLVEALHERIEEQEGSFRAYLSNRRAIGR